MKPIGTGRRDREIPAMSPKMWPLSKIVPYPNNPRTHPVAQIELLAKIIKQRGADQPIVVDETGIILKGHGRLQAAQLAGLAEFPVIVRKGLSDTDKRAIRIEDNSLSLMSGWDQNLIRGEIEVLKLAGYDIPLLGFDESQLAQFYNQPNPGRADPDEVPEPPAKPVTRKGDLWVMGGHRLLCADSTAPKDVARVMDGRKALVMATDPPYGVAYDNAERPNPGVAKPRVANDELVEGPAMQAFLEKMLSAALPHMDAHAAFYFWHPMLTQGTYVAAAAAAAGILIHRQIIWVKTGMLLGRGDYHWRHELCFYGWQQGNRPPFFGPRNQDTIWEVASVSNKERKEMNHATPKPVALWDKPIANHTKQGGILYEPFSGSGTQIIAAEATGRRCCAMELAEAYCDVAVLRWQTFTGAEVRLGAPDGPTYAQVKADRANPAPKPKGAPRTASARLKAIRRGVS